MVRRRGVTLIELMVVLGIVLVLIAILVPVLAAARRRARDADTRSQLASLRSACEGYLAMFKGYAGPMRESDLASDMGFSGSQNLTLGLMGTMQDNGTSNSPKLLTLGTAVYALTPLPKGVDGLFRMYASFEPKGIVDMSTDTGDVNNPYLQHQPFYTARSSELKEAAGGKVPANSLAATYSNGSAYPQNVASRIQVLHDRYGDPLPVLYFRRNEGVISPVMSENASTTGAYYRASNIAYLGTAGGGVVNLRSPSGRECPQSATAAVNAQIQAELTDPTTNGPRAMFVLISAGADRIYGTADDIVDPAR